MDHEVYEDFSNQAMQMTNTFTDLYIKIHK